MKVVVSESEIVEICKRIGKDLTEKFKDEKDDIIVAGVMKGAIAFHSELIKYINLPIIADYIQASSFNGGLVSTGVVTIKKDLDTDIKGKNLVIVEDIIDSGLTMKNLVEMLNKREPKSITIVTLLNNPANRKVDIEPDFFGKVVHGEFVVGFGFDLEEKLRNIPEVVTYEPNYDYFKK